MTEAEIERLASTITTITITTETGYVGNLTLDQEKKLQQLWLQLLAAFNFQHDDTLPQDSQDSVAALSQGDNGKAPSTHHQVNQNENQKENHDDDDDDDTVLLARKLRETWLSMVKQENPDALLLRFLRARKWDVAAAFAMLRNALLWRCDEMRVDEEVLAKGEAWCVEREKIEINAEEGGESSNDKVKEKGKEKEKEKDKVKDREKQKEKQEERERKDAHDFLEQLRMGKVYIHGTDRRGRPVGYVKISLHKPGQQSQETLEKLVVHTIETARCLFATPSSPAESFCVVFDLTDFSLSNMEWQPVKFIIRAFEANYPECLGALLIHNAPWIFSGIWKVIRGLLDPVVAAKVDFTRNIEGLEKYIARENILSAYGGGDDWVYTYIEPSADEDARITQDGSFYAQREEILAERREIAERFLAATQAWIRHGEVPGEQEEAAIQAQLRINAVEALWSNYWKLDPYVRSRTVLDRTGVIGAEGAIELYPDRRKKAEEEAAIAAAAAATDDNQEMAIPIKKKSRSRQ